MQTTNPNLIERIILAFQVFFKTLLDVNFATEAAQRLTSTEDAPTPTPATPPPIDPLKTYSPDAALQLIGLLQQEARFIDFIEENISQYSDAEIGAAARIIHAGSHKILHQHFTLAPIRNEAEESRITLPEGFDAAAVRLTGNVVGNAPFTGTLIHRGWQVTEVKLPKVAEGHNLRIVAAAEVEL